MVWTTEGVDFTFRPFPVPTAGDRVRPRRVQIRATRRPSTSEKARAQGCSQVDTIVTAFVALDLRRFVAARRKSVVTALVQLDLR
jgi:hypothetical protein